MLRAALRMAGIVALAMALVVAVLDITRSIADQAVILTPLGADWLRLSPETLDSLRETVSTQVHPWLWSPAITTILAAPTWAVFAAVAIVLGALSARRRRRWQENYGA